MASSGATRHPMPPAPVEMTNRSSLLKMDKDGLKRQAREVREGFPREAPFTSIDEIKEYLHGDRILCLLCGKPYLGLSPHLSKIHKMKGDDYRAKYGLPFGCGLTAEGVKEKLRNVRLNDSEEVKASRVAKLKSPAVRAKANAAATQQRTSGLKRLHAIDKLDGMAPTAKTFGEKEALAVVKAMQGGALTLNEALALPGGMSPSVFSAIKRQYESVASAYAEVSGLARRRLLVGNQKAKGNKGRWLNR